MPTVNVRLEHAFMSTHYLCTCHVLGLLSQTRRLSNEAFVLNKQRENKTIEKSTKHFKHRRTMVQEVEAQPSLLRLISKPWQNIVIPGGRYIADHIS